MNQALPPNPCAAAPAARRPVRGVLAPLLAALPAVLPPVCGADPDAPLDRPYTLRNAEPAVLEMEYHRMIADPRADSYAFPRPCVSALDSSRVCPGGGLWRHEEAAAGRLLIVSPVAGAEYRVSEAEGAAAADMGLVARGRSGPASFLVDGRIFAEFHEDAAHASFDREFVERQDEQASGSVAYSSYARYRSNLAFDWSWGRLTAGRDAAHWGPAQFNNLVFHQDAVPFNQLALLAHLGPVTVKSLYGRLTIPDDEGFGIDSLRRSVYAHRYELRLGSRAVVALSEQLILFNAEAPFAFAPVVPLFMAKGVDHEHSNNGNLSFDAAYTFPGRLRLYGEFLVDDMQSPTSLFDDFWGNKWAALVGAHGIASLGRLEAGLVGEWSRVEPWVYTHYRANTAQSAHSGYPLGNQAGPNSMSANLKAYVRAPGAWYLSARLDVAWKGTGMGSSLDDGAWDPGAPLRKDFLGGSDGPEAAFRPYASWRWRTLALSAEASLGSDMRVAARAQYGY